LMTVWIVFLWLAFILSHVFRDTDANFLFVVMISAYRWGWVALMIML